MIRCRAHHAFNGDIAPLIDAEIIIDWREVACLMAPSGSGKSTLFRLMASYYPASLLSRCVFDPALDAARDVCLIGNSLSLLPWLTVDQNVSFYTGRPLSPRVIDALSLPNVVNALHPYELSTGMYKRAELAIAVALAPKVLLLDEFFTSFDDDVKNGVRDFIRAERGALPTWVSSHEIETCNSLTTQTFTFRRNEVGTIVGLIST